MRRVQRLAVATAFPSDPKKRFFSFRGSTSGERSLICQARHRGGASLTRTSWNGLFCPFTFLQRSVARHRARSFSGFICSVMRAFVLRFLKVRVVGRGVLLDVGDSWSLDPDRRCRSILAQGPGRVSNFRESGATFGGGVLG